MATRDGTRGRDQDIPNYGVPGASSVGAPIARKGTPESSQSGDLQLDHLVDDQVQPSRGITFVVCEACGGSMPARPCPADSPMNGATSHDVCDSCKPGYEARIRALEAEVRCPIGVEGDQIRGCGSSNVTWDDSDGVYDCRDCGIWFVAEKPGMVTR